jgi:RHS repeat-associated protein
MAGTANAISFVWDGTDLLNEYVPGGLSGRYLTLDGEVLSEKRGASRYVYGVDPLGSVVHLLDSGLNRAGTYVYWPYGEVLSHTGADTPMQYVGRWGYYTATTNRLYVRARWLRPDLGRWMTEDPIGFEGGDWNLYGYARKSPTSHGDPTGLIGLPVLVGCALACGCVGGMVAECLDDMHNMGGGLDQFVSCMKDTFNGLPPWGKALVGVCYGGCLACVVAAMRVCARPTPRPRPVPPPLVMCRPNQWLWCARKCFEEGGPRNIAIGCATVGPTARPLCICHPSPWDLDEW